MTQTTQQLSEILQRKYGTPFKKVHRISINRLRYIAIYIYIYLIGVKRFQIIILN